jgi:hypothetical protein
MRNVIITALISTIITVSFNANARFSIKLEYELMQKCIQKPWTFDKLSAICACAIRKSNDNGYSNDSSFRANESGFMKGFEKNTKWCN